MIEASIQDDEVIDILKSMVTTLELLRKKAEQLLHYEMSEVGNAAYTPIVQGLEQIKMDIADVARQHNFGELSLSIKKTLSEYN